LTAFDPLIDDGAGDAEALGKFGDGVEAFVLQGNEASAFEHRVGRGKGHGRLR
jgi:hypothetical protein